MTSGLRAAPAGDAFRIVIDRPERRNALTPELARGIAEAVEQAGAAGARAVIITGGGGHFSAGLDLHWLGSLGAAPSRADVEQGLRDFQRAILAVVRSPLPVIAVVRGTAAGFGLDLALACDMRVAGRSARFTSAFARMGLVPDGGSTVTLAALIGPGRALRLLLTDQTLDADAALAIGLVDDLADDDAAEDAAAALVAGIARTAPGSVRTIKRLARAGLLGALEETLAAEGAAQMQALAGEEFRSRAAAFRARSV